MIAKIATLRELALATALVITAEPAIFGQTTVASGGTESAAGPVERTVALASADAPAPDKSLSISLQDALARARANSAQFQTAITDRALAREDRVQARAGLLPTVNYTTSYLYTEGNGTPSGRFIANNGVHEYVAQGNAHEVVGLNVVADYRRASAAVALANARAEVAARGLVVTVVQNYYGLVIAERKLSNAQAAATEAGRFLRISQQLEHGGEVAHSDVIKAQLQSNDRRRDVDEASLALNKAKLALAVFLFPNFGQDFTVVDDLRFAPPLPPFAEAQQLAERGNVDLKVAAAALRVAGQELTVARAGHLPSLTLDYWYGIDATRFAVRTDGVRNLGYAAAATLNLPVFSWGATQSKVKQAELRRRLAQVELSQTQREAIANLNAFYAEAATARAQLELLHNSADLAAESLRLTVLRYQAGEATALEVVDAQNSLTQARNAFDDGEARYRIALASLQTLTGNF